jgi:hypothetical protein
VDLVGERVTIVDFNVAVEVEEGGTVEDSRLEVEEVLDACGCQDSEVFFKLVVALERPFQYFFHLDYQIISLFHNTCLESGSDILLSLSTLLESLFTVLFN